MGTKSSLLIEQYNIAIRGTAIRRTLLYIYYPFSILILLSYIAPVEAPQNVTAVLISPTSILFTCYPPSPSLQNGLIRNYKLEYYSEWNFETIETVTIFVDTTESYPTMLHQQIELSLLQPYTMYTFSVIAINDAGQSPNTTTTTRTHLSGMHILQS